jgi:hypothetical protein
MDAMERATGLPGRTADIMTRDSIHETLREDMEASAVRLFRINMRLTRIARFDLNA